MTELETDLLPRAQRGEPAAVEALLGAIAPRVRRFAQRLCGSAPDADDVLQDTLLTVARQVGQFDGRGSLASWVFTVTRNACLRRRRGLKNAPPRADDPELPDDEPNPEARAAESELVGALRAALRELPLEAREVILLRDVEGLSAAEAASVLRISQQALKSRLHRARSALRERLEPWLEPSAPPPSASCPDVMALWSKKLEGDLNQLDCATMEAHVLGCPACGSACAALKQALDLCRRSASETTVPPSVQARVKAATRAWAAERAHSG
ncbi:MAG TPA: RNA polymerase sigma factor [Polyangiaceae bacterium]|nr:RNA polymerase sigma factor [Polyangiaceae bacterium]